MVQPGTAIAVIGGPPCQGFTTANVKADSNDPRNQLVLLYLDIIAALQQQYTVVFTVLENVPGLLGIKHADTVKDLFSKYDGLRHETVLGVHNAIDFGVAQERKRVIFTSFNDPNNAARFGLHPTSTAKHTVREMIGTLPEPAFFARHMPTVPFHANHWTMQPRSKRFTTPNTSGKSRSFRRLQWDKPSPTVAYGNREIHVHPMGHRRLSVYEAMLLQGFPPDFELKGSFSEQVEQISNAVPVPLAKALAESIKHALIGGVQWPTLLSA